MPELPHLLEGNIKQRILPFCINPNFPINKATSDGELETASPQVFTFKTYENFSNTMTINFLPKSAGSYCKEDIGHKLIYKLEGKESLDLSEIFNLIPSVSIREFLPDLKIDQVISFVNLFLPIIDKIIEDIKKNNGLVKNNEKNNSSSNNELLTPNEAFYITKYFIYNLAKYVSSSFNEKSLASDLIPTEGKATMPADMSKVCQDNANIKAFVYQLPFLIYYCLLSNTTTNIYEIPFTNEPKTLYSSDGGAGWREETGGFVSNMLKGIPFVGSLMPNIGISLSPWWNSSSGQATSEDEVQVNFDLYNDSYESAMNNFIFVNTIIPNNKWLQYGLLLHSPCLYDVRIEGARRLYACTGTFKVTYGGVMRSPQHGFLYDLYEKHTIKMPPKNANGEANYAYNNKYIKIPDVYHVQLTFSSLFPSNLNLFLFLYAANASQIATFNGKARYVMPDMVKPFNKVKDSVEAMYDDAKNKGKAEALLKKRN